MSGDFTLELACEFREHDTDDGHEGPARYWMRFEHECDPPLENRVYAICAKFATTVLQKEIRHELMSCEVCGDIGEFRSFLKIIGVIE